MKSKIILLLIVFCSISSISFGQKTSYQYLDTLVTSFVKELQMQNTDTICIYQSYYDGSVVRPDYENDGCSFKDISIKTYILWLDQGKIFLTKKDNCYDYSSIEIDSVVVWKLFFKYENQIKKEKVKPFEYFVTTNKKKEKFFMLPSHSNIQRFEITVNGYITVFKLFDEVLKKEDGGYVNINYKHNHKLKGKKIIDELERLVQHIESKKLLTKNRR